MSKRRGTRLAAGMALALAGLGAALLIAGRTRAAPIRIGVLLPLTGPDAAVGLGMRAAVRLAVEEHNRRGGVKRRAVELVELDDASDMEQARAAATRLIADPTVVVAITGYDADAYTAIQNDLRDGKLAGALVAVSNWDKMRLRGPSEFRIVPFGSTQQKHAAEHAWHTLGARSFAYVTDDTYYGASTVNHFRDGLRPMLGEPGAEMVVRRGEREFQEVVSQLVARPPDYVFFGGRPLEAALLLGRLRAAGVKSRFQAGTHFPSDEFIAEAKGDAEGALATFHGPPATDLPGGKAFLDAYAAHAYAQPPSIYGLYAYASAQTVLQALERSTLTRPSVTGALSNESFETALGPIKYNYFGSNYQAVVLYEVQGGRWTPVLATDKTGKLQPYTPSPAR